MSKIDQEMLEVLENLENESKILEPDSNTRIELRNEIVAYTEKFLDEIESIPAYFKRDEGDKSPLEEEAVEGKRELSEVIGLLRETMDAEGINPASGGHLGYIPGGGIYLSSLADYWAAITNRYAGVFYANPGAVRIENKLIRWMAMKLGYPSTAHGNLTSGGSLANLTAIVTARHAKGIDSSNMRKSCIYITTQAHQSISKAIQVSGLFECQLRYVELDEMFRMDVEDLQQKIKKDTADGLQPFLIVASAGTTDMGAIDPLDKLADIAKQYDAWLHVDAAYGGFFVLTDEGKEKFKGIDRSNSCVIDPHKGMFLPYGLGICLVREPEVMRRAFTFKASYLQDIYEINEEINPMDVSPEMTKHFRGLRMWLPLKIYGQEPFVKALEEKLLLAKYFWHRLQEDDRFEPDLYPQLSVVTFRAIDAEGRHDQLNRLILEEIHRDGTVFFSSTTVNDKFSLRFAILSFRTHRRTIDKGLELLNSAWGNAQKKLNASETN